MATNIIINLVFIAVLLGLAVLGAVFGFGRMLQFTTRGIAGIIISIFFITLFGAALLATPAISGLVDRGNAYFYDVWRFLGWIRLATVIYFIILFIVLQTIRMVIVLVIRRITEIDKKGIKIANKIIGTLYMMAFGFFVCLLVLALLRLFENAEIGRYLLQNIEGSWLERLFRNNFIVFGA